MLLNGTTRYKDLCNYYRELKKEKKLK